MVTTTAGAASFHVAIDLGAGSGRAMLGRLGPDGLALEEVHRFHYPPAPSAGRLRWSFEAILAGMKEGLGQARSAAAARNGALAHRPRLRRRVSPHERRPAARRACAQRPAPGDRGSKPHVRHRASLVGLDARVRSVAGGDRGVVHAPRPGVTR